MKWLSFFFLIRKYILQKRFYSCSNKTQNIRNADLEKECQNATKQASYIKSMSYWPIAKTEIFTKPGTLVYLHVNKVKRHKYQLKAQSYSSSITSLFKSKLKKKPD